MSNLKLAFVIEAVDKATSRVRSVNATIDRITAPVRRVRAAFNGLVREGRFERVQAAAQNLGERFQKMAGWVSGVVRGFGMLTFAAGGAAFAMKRNVDVVDGMLDQAKKLGLTIERYQELGYAAQLNGSSQEEMGQALQFLAQNMVEAINGSKEMQTWFARVGISMQQLRRMNVADVMEAIADKFKSVGDAGQNAEKKIAVMRAMMGRGGAELKQTLDLGSAGLREFYAEAKRLGAVIDGDTADAMNGFNDNWDRMRLSLRGAMAVVTRAALPVLDALVNRVTAWSVASRGLAASRMAEFVERVVVRLPAFLEAVISLALAIGGLVTVADRVAQLFGGWEVVFAAVAGVIIGQGVFAVYTLIAAMFSLQAAFFLTPFGWVVAGVAAVAAGAALIYTKWEPIKRFFTDLWQTVGRVVDRVSGFFGGGSTGGASGGWQAPAAARPAPNAIVARGGPYRDGLGGTLRIQIDADGKPRVKDLSKKAGSPLDFDVYTGAQMVTQ